MTKFIGPILAFALLAGCSLLEKGGNVQQNPIVQGTINVAAKEQCRQFAKDQPEDARTTGQYLSTLAGATQACVDGINDGLTQ